MLKRFEDAWMPYQTWKPFPDEAIVLIYNKHGERKVGPVSSFWWGFQTDMGTISENVIVSAKRLDRPKRTYYSI